MFPVLLLISVVFTYSVAWFLYYSMAGPITFSALPLDPRRVWKLNKVVFSVIFSNLGLIPIGLSLIRYRYLTMRGSSGLITDVPYNPRRPDIKLDIYAPDQEQHHEQLDSKALRPVILFIYGGAWSSGSKWLYTLVGARLRSMGYVVFMPDYAIYPQGYVADMEQDVKTAVQWTHSHCQEFGGDPQRIYLMGHSAGAHLCALTVLNDGIQRIPVSLFGSSSSTIASSPILSTLLNENLKQGHDDILPRLRGMILCSGVYDISEHFKHESMRGVEEISAMARVMGNSHQSFRAHSPTNILQELLQVSTRIDKNYPTESQTRHQHLLRHFKSILPMETLVIHGDKDRTVPVRSSLEFLMELKTLQLGSGARMRVIKGMAHEEPVVALMSCFGGIPPFRKPLMDELSHPNNDNRLFDYDSSTDLTHHLANYHYHSSFAALVTFSIYAYNDAFYSYTTNQDHVIVNSSAAFHIEHRQTGEANNHGLHDPLCDHSLRYHHLHGSATNNCHLGF
ncbi:hypothetical protein BGZ83_001706 [Gryganskiella cystojenkinii]|nr:hypothetical protein BGZ83_001706 [Gryganskiella cystojenkinii]